MAEMVTSIREEAEGELLVEVLTGKPVPLEMAGSRTAAPVGLMGDIFIEGPEASENLIG